MDLTTAMVKQNDYIYNGKFTELAKDCSALDGVGWLESRGTGH